MLGPALSFFFPSKWFTPGTSNPHAYHGNERDPKKIFVFFFNIMQDAWAGVGADPHDRDCLLHRVCGVKQPPHALPIRLQSKQETRCSLMLIMAFIININ